MSATDIISRNAKKKKGKSQESVSGADRIIRRSIENNAKKIIYNELQTLGKMQNESISSAKRRYKYDENGNRIISYLPDTASYYEGVQNRRNEYQKKSDYVNYIIKEYGSKLNEDDLNNISNFLSSGNSYFNSLTDFAREDNEYFSQWADEDAYNRDYDNYTYSNKYKGKTYADLMKAKTDVEKKLSINKDDDTLNRELYWLENHKTDKQFADTMTTEELKQYKADNEERVKELKAKISKLKLEKFSYEIGGQTGEGNQRYKSISNEIKSAENELKGLKGKNSSVLYYDDEGIAVTTDSLLNIRENEGILSKINNDENVKSAYEKAIDSSEKIKSLDKRATEIRNEITKYERAGVVPDGLNAELTSILNTINKHKEAIEGFNSLGYDFESLEHYKRWDEDRKNYAENQAKNEQYAKEHPFLATGKAILSAPVTALELAGNLSDSLQYGYANIYDDKYTMRNETYQSTVSNLINDAVYDSTNSELVSWLASSAYSGVTSAGQSALTAAACTVLFGGNIGGGVALAVMSTESASSAYRTAIMNGSTNQEALLTSVASGIGEALFEKIPLDNLLKLGKGTDINSMVDLLKGLAKQSAIEGLEEGGTEIWNTMADAIINGDHSAYNTSIDKYMKMGYSKMDATDLASKEWVNEFLTSFVGGMFGGLASGASAGVIPAVHMGINNAEQNKFYNQQGQNIVESGNVGELVDTARGLSNGSKSLQKLANEVAGVNTEIGLSKRQNAKYSKNVGKLYKAVQETQAEGATNAERTTFKAMVKEELNGNKNIKNIDKVAEIITKKKFDSLSRAEQKNFDKVDGNTILEKVNNSEEFDSKVKQTATENAENFVKTGLLTINEKQAIAEGTGYDISDDGKTYIEATGEEISIKSIKSVGNDDVVVTLDSGDHISVGELMVSQDIAVISNGLKKLNANFNIDTDTSNYIFNMWKSKAHDLSAKEFMLGVTSAMEYGKINDEGGLETDAFTKDLPAELRKEMFDMARCLEESNVQSKQNAIDEAKTIRRESGKGKARAEGTGTVKYDGINENSLDSKQKAQADLISTVMSVMGINVEFFASPVMNETHIGESGSYNPNTNTIRIDIFAGNEGKGLMLYTASHELTHFIRKWSPTKFKVFADFLMQNYKENNVPVKELIQAKINNAKLNGRTLSYDAAYEEVVADACERFLADSNAKDMLVSLAQQDQSLAQKVLKWIKDFVDLIKNALDAIKGYDADSKESAYVQEMTDALEGLRYLWDEALFDAMESYQWVGERVNTNEIAGIDYDNFESAKNENGEELFQYRAIQHDVPEYRALLEKYGTLNATEIDNLFNTMEKAFAIIEENLEILDYAWDENLNEDGTWDDSTDARAFKPVKPNSDKLYKYSLDFSTLCRKRLLQQVIVEELSMALDRAVTKAESIAIRDELIKLQEEGRQLEIACALCYVESARMKSPEQIQKFLNDAGQKVREFFGAKAKTDVVTAEENIRKKLAKKYAKEIKEGKMPSPTETVTTKSGKKKWISLSSLPSNVAWEIRDAKREAKASYTPTAEENELINIADNLPTSTFTTAEGLKNLAKEQPVIFDAYTSFIRNATHSKGTEKDVWYRVGDADIIGDDLIAAMNKENGLRSQSWSDFQVIHLLDYVGAIIELSTKNAKMQSYTKVADYVNLMGLTDMMINLSLIPTSEFNEKLDFDSIEGMAFRVALELRDKYPNTAGTISIGVADEQIKKLLESADIDYVIPYHQSGMKKAVRKVMHIPTWESYEAYQGEKKITSRKDAMANADKYGVKLLATGNANYHKAPNFSEWFDLDLAKKITELENIKPTDEKAYKKYGTVYGAYKAMQDAADTYIKLCAERGLMPKFSYGKVDFSKESNYWKLLIDRKMINQKTGEIIEQKAVKPVFNEKEILGILNNEIARYEGVKEDFDYATHYVVERFLNGDMDEHINDIAKHIGETVNNVTKVASVDVEGKHQDRDSEGRELTPEQGEFFKDSKIRDENGNLLVAYHGTDAEFNTFDADYISQDNKLGFGFYFKIGEKLQYSYEHPKTVYLNITNPITEKSKTISKDALDDLCEKIGINFDYDVSDYDLDIYQRLSYAYTGNTREFLNHIVNILGVDGIVSKDRNTAVAFNSNQIKLIDNLNPTENEDIRYQDRDSTGRELSPQQAEFFKDSKVRDEDGNLIPVYHGTYENFTVFDINKTSYSNIYGQGHYFTSNKQDANQNYATLNGADVKTKIDSLAYSYFEEMGYTEDDLYDNDHVDEWNEAYDKAEAYYESGRVVEAYLNIKNPVYADRYESLYDKDGNFVSERTIEGLKARGFDGIIDYRVSEKFDFQHLDEDTAHYIVFDSNQIKLVDNLNPTENEDIRYSDRYTPIDLTKDNELSKLIGDKTGSKKYNAIRDYIWDLLGNRDIVFSDGTSAIIDRSDALHIANKAYDQKTAEISAIEKLIKSAVLFAEDYTEHKKFNYFRYYAVNVKHGNDEFPIYLNVGRGKNDKLFHLYDITKKIRDTANRINGFEGLHEFPSINSISVNSISNSPKNVNTKFQDRPYQVTLDDLGIDYKEENEKLKTDIDRLKDLVKFQKTLTHGTAFSTTSVNKQASMLMQEFGLHRGKEELAKMLNEYYSFIAKGEDLSWNIVIGKAEDIAKWIDSHIVRKVEIDGYSKSILSHIRSLRIKLDDVQKAEVAHRYGSYEAFRKSNIGNFILTDNGTELDSIWQELAELYPDTFDNDVNSADMPLLLAELLTDIRTTDNLLNKFNKTDELRWMAEEIYDSYWGVSTIHSLADKQQKEVNLLKSKHRQQMDELRENYANREKNAKDKFNEMLKKVKADKDAKFEAYKELKEEQKKNARERRNKTAIKNKFKTVVKELNSILNNGTKERNVKIDLQPTVSKALELAEYLFDDNISNEFVLTKANLTPRADEQPIYDKWINAYRTKQKHLATIESLTNKEGSATTTANLYDIIAKLDNRMKTYEKQLSSLITEARSSINNDGVTNSVNALADAYAELKNSSEEHVKGAYNDGVYDLIKTLAKELSGTKISDMNNIQMQHLYDAFKMVLYTVRTSNELFIDGKKMKVEEFSKAILREISAMKKSKALPNEKLDKIKDKINSYNWNELKPYYAFNRIGSKTLMQLYEEARKAEDILGRDYDEAIQFAEKMKAKYGYDSWDMDKAYDVKLSSGRTIKLSLQELMSIYAYSKREQAYAHMKFGGFVFEGKKYFENAQESTKKLKTTEKIENMLKQTVREMSAEAYTFDETDLATVKELIKAQVGFVDEMQDFLSTVMGAKGNEISRQLYGVDWFKEKFYFPLKSSHDFLAVINQVSENYSLRNSGMTKATVPHAQNPIVLEDFMSVWSNHVGKMSTYHALVLPIDNLNKALSYKGQTISVKSTLKSVFGKSVEDYLNNFIKDLNGGVTSQGATSPLAKMFSKFKKTAVSASTSVVVQQPTAILRAMAYINPKYFVGASDKLNHKDKWNLIKKYAPVAVLKEIGGFDIGGGKQLESIITSKSYKGIKKIGGVVTDSNYRDEVLMKPAGVADEIGWNIIWSAIEREVKSTTNLKIGTEEFYQECGKRFTETVHKTQVYDSTFTKSGYQRSKYDAVQMAMAFMGEPTTSYNMLFDAVTQVVRGNISKGKAAVILGTTLASIVMAAVAKSFIYALRDDDEDESYAEKYVSSLTDNLISDLHIHNMLPFIKDFVSIFNGWDVERTDMAIFKDIKDALDGLGSTTKSTYRKMEDLLGAVASAFGVPLKNLMRTGREMYNAGRNLFDDNVASSKDVGKAVSSTIVGEDSMSKVNDLLAKGNTAKAKEMITEILNDKINEKVSEGLSREEAIKKSKSSIRSSLTREWKPLYLEAYANRDMAKMNDIRKILNSTGIYGSLSELDEALADWKKSDD